MAESYRYPKCFGPYLRYAIQTDFRSFASFETGVFTLFLLVEFEQAGLAKPFDDEMTKIGLTIRFGASAEDQSHTRYVTMLADKSAVTQSHTVSVWEKIVAIWERYVSRVELSLPLKPSPKSPFLSRMLVHRWQDGASRPGKLLIGMMDDGCPFAAARFLTGRSTRVRGIWDQDQGRQPVNVVVGPNNSRPFGHVPPDFQYGFEFARDFRPPVGPEIGLDEWINRHLMPTTNSVDEDACYADADFTNLAQRELHGAHVMDVFAGSIPISSRIGPSQPGQDRRDPPSWLPGNPAVDLACGTDLVFVQFAKNCIEDATGVWLLAYVEQGIQYILSFAEPYWTERVIINLSYGPTTGPHDGTALLEARLTALVNHFNGSHGRPRLEIVLAAGNACLTEGHVVHVRHHHHPHHVEWTWRLPPDNPVLCFAEIWMTQADATGVAVSLISPSGVLYPSTANPAPNAPAGVDAPVAWSNYDTMWRLQVEPTIAGPGIVAEHGDWTVKVEHLRHNAELHAYVARTDPNLGVRTGAKASRFVDPNWERTRSDAASSTRVNGEFDKAGSLIHRHGTLNGIATAEDPSVHVAGGYIIIDGRKSTYASAGPARSGPLVRRRGPDYALPCDETFALEGIRAGGTRSGSVFRLVGTSVAAPQLAREVVRGPLPAATRIPNTPAGIEELGGGDLEPP
jgi:hypothetical protein